MNIPFPSGGLPHRFTSPVLRGLILRECPVGYVLRESPQTYEALTVLPLVAQGSAQEFQGLPRYIQQLSRVYGTEKDRIRELDRVSRQSSRDAQYGARVRGGG